MHSSLPMRSAAWLRSVEFAGIIGLLLLSCVVVTAQEREADSPYKLRRSSRDRPLIIASDLNSQLLESFVLMQKANAGDPLAQHELGYRYLMGRGYTADTVKAAYWIEKAADRGLPLAQFNLGILHNHGWGVPWNPFEAFRQFRNAATRGMPDALFVLGLLYTEDLIVPRNWNAAYRYLKQSADAGYAPAKEAFPRIEKRLREIDTTLAESHEAGLESKKRSSGSVRDTSWGLVYLNFQSDPAADVPDTTLLREAMNESGAAFEKPAPAPFSENPSGPDSSWIEQLTLEAEIGSPEALVLLGRMRERGIWFPPDLIRSAEYYLRAIRLDSPRAPRLLWNLTQEAGFFRQLSTRAESGEVGAQYVWSGLTSIGFDKLLGETQALQLLQRASDKGNVPSMIDLGVCYYQGRWVRQDRSMTQHLWQEASKLGSLEANVRLAAADVLGEFHTHGTDFTIPFLRDAAHQGSVLAETALGYCYEHGVGVQRDKGEAALMYRRAAQRGNQLAYFALRRLHDELRPAEKEFQMSD